MYLKLVDFDSTVRLCSGVKVALLVEEAAGVAQKSSYAAQSCYQQQWTAHRQTGTSSLEAPRILTLSVATLLCVAVRGGWVFGFS
ncbi:hypothetical protein [Microcoleus sp. herbarium14]|uniref:hypothetical protein n=1 Tax=Microcoleus sp. herbarium14 TaxID=3055439 RepID=UPI002FD4CE0D